MNTQQKHIEIFLTRSYERSVDHLILSNKDYIIPQSEINKYLSIALSIPFSEYINFIQNHKGIINANQLTQSSNFDACSSEMCKALKEHGNPGMKYIDIGRLFPQYIKQKNDTAFRKYGENQIKTSAQLGLTFEYFNYWYLSCVGYVYNELDEKQQKALLARTVLRVPLYQDLLVNLLDKDVYLTNYMKSIAPSTQGRRAGSIIRLLNNCLDECKSEGITYHDLYYPMYQTKTKSIITKILVGTTC